ncbi:uncharacterized protein BX663DRAFT_493362 [Cokeromyces recurvatus]|uniref:uncharacterized protein n=1 Tax=Cokeromyces recurvatus TaxID=90255 RepID=UPI00221F19C7|nr:uncharacterized protein BX663DRAFT_493362 [Cokeromyces recurvatus]KAI7908198.1 hypothetical protein BX663DRAFT_493362 [Cokeromyces recurvatus]
MHFDNNTSVQKSARPFVYIQYPKINKSTTTSNKHTQSYTTLFYNNKEQQHTSHQISISSPSSTSSSSSTITSPIQINKFQLEKSKDDSQPKKKKRQHTGYACDKCRERRVGCDRVKPICGQCKDRYNCTYSNHALRVDSTSMRQRLDDLENQVSRLTSFVTHLEQEHRSITPYNRHVQHPFVTQLPILYEPNEQQDSQVLLSPSKATIETNSSVYDWAIETGWPVIENTDGMRSIFTNIKSFDDLSEALKNTVNALYNLKGHTLYKQPSNKTFISQQLTLKELNCSSVQQNDHKIEFEYSSSLKLELDQQSTANKKEHIFTLFESLNRYSKSATNSKGSTEPINLNEQYLELNVMTRLIHQHHQCGFPTLVSPCRFEKYYQEGQLKSIVLSSVLSHSVPHCCIYHPQLVQIQDFGELGNKFYNHSHDLLDIDEPANLSNIHQRIFLITYDLDLGRVRRAFLHLGIAIRMCYILNLHCPEGYMSCKSAFEREQSKRVFWTVWFYDNMVSQLFHDQLSTFKLNDISIELPIPLPEFNQIEMDQTTFAINIIEIRMIAASISEESHKIEPRILVNRFREKLWRYYNNTLSKQSQFRKEVSFPPNTSIWARRSYFCTLLDYCQCWITIYRSLLPSANYKGDKPLTRDEIEAILHTSQAAVAIVQLFQNWFKVSLQSEEGFDCFFRPYLYHFMSAKYIFSSNVSQIGRSPALIYVSRAYLILLLQLYQTTPTRKSFDESQLENDMMQFIEMHQIDSSKDVFVHQTIIDEALLDDSNADGGWSIFSCYTDSALRDKFGKSDYLHE